MVVIYLRRQRNNLLNRNVLDGQQEAPVNTVLQQHPQNCSRGTRPYTFPRSTKHV